MDPQQRLLLETTYEALESAGIRQEDIQQSNTAVYMAMFTRDYDRNVYKDMMSIPKYHVTGTGDAILANRISHLFDLRGPSVTMDTGCSGGMAAISHACQALRSGQSDMALAGAANLILSPDHMVSMSNLHMLNQDGRSYSFDTRGAGYGRGEGIATLVIKRLDDALRDRDPIRAVLRDACINQDGHTAGITLPSGSAQEALARGVWGGLALDPQEVGYVEAHGTGTLAGDSAELDSISRVFCRERESESSLMVGSIKSNIGHLESASGLAAMIKAILVLEHSAVPPNANFEHPRGSLDLAQKKITVPRTLQPLPSLEDRVLRVAVNSFGYGGTNAHAVLERPPSFSCPREDMVESFPRLYSLSASSQSSLHSMLGSMAEWVSQHEEKSSLRDLAYTLSERRSIMPWRFSTVASTQAQLLQSLRKASQTTDSVTRISPEVNVSLIFSGQGAQWAGMGCELLADPIFHGSICKSNEVLKTLGSPWDLAEELSRGPETSRLKEAELAQPVTTAVQIALVDLVRSWGIVPDSVVGHSSGEIAAAYAAGHLTQHQAIKAAYFRGFSSTVAKEKGFGNGAMLAVGVGEDEILPYLESLKQGIAVVACQNSPSSVTISGDASAISELSTLLTIHEIFNRRLLVDTAYHSHHMQAAAEEYRTSLGVVAQSSLPETAVKMFSSVIGGLKSSQFDGDYWVSNLVNKVRFCDALQALCRAGHTASKHTQPHRIFIEIGPHSALAGPARQCIAGLEEPLPYSYTSVLVRGTGAIDSALAMAGDIFSRGYALDLSAASSLDPTRATAAVLNNLPSYPWDRSKRYWHESRLSRDYRLRKHPYHDLLGIRMTDNTPLRPVWRHMIGVEGLPWLRDHVIDGLIVFPGAGYLCMAMEAASQLASERYPARKMQRMRLQNVSFLKGLVIPDGRARVEAQLAFSPEGTDTDNVMQHGFSVTTLTGEEQWNENCRGSIIVEFASDSKKSIFDTLVTYGETAGQLGPASARYMSGAELYYELNQVGNTYGPTFSGIQELHLGEDVAVSIVAIPDARAGMPANHHRRHIIHPSTLDILLHSSLPLVNQKMGAGSVMPVRIDNLDLSLEVESAPGSMLSAVTTVTSSRFRAAEANLLVFPGRGSETVTPVISVSGMELRSLAAEPLRDVESQAGRNMCYQIQWVPDEQFISADALGAREAMTSGSSLSRCYALLSEYLRHKALKQSGLSVMEIGGGPGEVRDTADDMPIEIREWDESIKAQALSIEKYLASQGFEQNSYDVVYTCNIRSVSHLTSTLSKVRPLLKAYGVLGFIGDTGLLSSEAWLTALYQASFQLQLVTDAGDLSFMVAKTIPDIPTPIAEVRVILEPTLPPSLRSVVSQISSRLQKDDPSISVIRQTIWDDKQPDDDAINLVIDNGSKPLLFDIGTQRFRQVVELLQKRARVIWVSIQDEESDNLSPRKHLITGLARTAHAENIHLEMVTVDVQQMMTQETWPKLCDFLSTIIRSFSENGDAGREREYVYTGTSVLVPRVIPSNTLNRQILRSQATITEAESFKYSRVPLKLDEYRQSASAQAIFVEDESHRETLPEGFVEIDSKAFGVVSNAKGKTPVNEYAGLVAAIGMGVSTVKVGDRVVGWAEASYASRPRISEMQVELLPDEIPFTAAAALPVAFMTAFHALIGIADIQPGQLVLIDGAASDIGQAAVSVARHKGACVIAAVTRSDEAKFLQDSFQVASSHIIARNSPFLKEQLRKLASGSAVDVVFACAESPIPNEIIKVLKPFGTLVQTRSRGNVQPTNGTVSTFDLGSLLKTSPRKASELLQQMMVMIGLGSPLSSFKVTTLQMDSLEEAAKLARQDGMTKYVVQVGDASTVKSTRPAHTLPRLEGNATYVIAGGLGDLGRRMLRLMAKAGARYFVTLSRSGARPGEHETVEGELQRLGAGSRLHCVKCDVSQEASGVIQATVVLQDSTLDTMTAEGFNSVLQAKAHGTLNLQKVFAQQEDLTFFICLSSAVNIIGTAGQANYNASNSLQDSLAQFRKDSSCFYMTLNIGVIEDASINNKTIVQSLRRQGLATIYHDELDAFFEYALGAEARHAGCHQAVLGFTPESIAETTAVNGAAHTLMFTHVRPTAKTDAVKTINGTRTFEELVALNEDRGEIEAFVAQSIGTKLADLILADPADVNLDESVTDLGLDSLIAIELRNWIMREFSAPIQSSEVLDSPNLWSLAKKVTSRSKLITSDENTEGDSASVAFPTSTLPTTRSSSQEPPSTRQLPLPIPDTAEALRMLADSRRAICSSEELEETKMLIAEFNRPGLELQDTPRADTSDAALRAEFYDRHIHLQRREPLQDHALSFTLAERAAIITVAALHFKKRLECGQLEQNVLNGVPLCGETIQWLFHTTQEPGLEVDQARKYLPSNNIVVMRKGRLYEVAVHEHDDYASLARLFAEIIGSPEQPAATSTPEVSVLTSKRRDEWAALRSQLQRMGDDAASSPNAATLAAVEASAFVVCLDDGAPETASARCTSILLNDRHLANRWLDKLLQFSVAANGVSALLAGNSKLDGLSTRQLCEHITDEILATPSGFEMGRAAAADTPVLSVVRPLTWELSPAMVDTIAAQTASNLARYPAIGATRCHYAALGRAFLGSNGLRSKGTVLIAILMATRTFYGHFEPVWETITVSKFAKGRIDWLQCLTPDIVEWVEAALVFKHHGRVDVTDLARKLKDAAVGHAQSVRRVADGHGYKAKVDCLGSGGYLRMQEGGFLMPNPDSVFVHYEVHHSDPLILVQGQEEDVARFELCLNDAVALVRDIIERGITR
ncbi:beta-ketoacyl synthase domain-containing protein [Apiospora arundinis]